MLKASALVYSLFISLLLVSLCSAIIAISYINSGHTVSWREREKVERNATSGITLLQNFSGIVSPNERKALDLFGNGNDSVVLVRKTWGAFEIQISEAFSRHHRFSRIALSGNGSKEDSTTALYLADQDKPLSLCGKTEIKGMCFLPKAGVKRAYIEGQNFIGADLIMGRIFPSSKSVSGVNENVFSSIADLFDAQAGENDSIINMDDAELPSLNRSFSLNTVRCRSTRPARIGSTKLKGNILLISDKEIKISPEASLQDVIVCAPKVIIEDGFAGCLQVFASDSVIVGEKAKLAYPSVIGLVRLPKSCQNATVILKEGAEVSGAVFASQESVDVKSQIKILIDKDVLVTGCIYSNGLLDLKGAVFGSVACAKFILSTPSSVYENHLLNAVIDRTRLSKYFIAPLLMKDAENQKTVKWLY